MDSMHTIGNNIRRIRHEQRMSQQFLASRAGISRNTLMSLENGKCKGSSIGVLLKLASALDTSVDVICSGVGGE